ncbi:transcriptional activator RfaH [Planctomycetes bacterium CA13]|uniref:Transcriptional activator RfaH n=1 Tax=Novipirellula herctigrandis TaxID=2527986 RepID=A0A5C5YNV2_9BACT|nr:transcriptional activator RfaH [Planctomycetes bacterium CA13]
MPILPSEPDCLPENLLERDEALLGRWWMMYTKSRQEKQLMRLLRQHNVWHYGPLVPQRKPSPAGRVRTTYMPLFSNYVFVCGTEDESRYQAICTGCILKATEITDVEEFVSDLKQIRSLINLGVPLTLESRLSAGQQVRIRTGPFAGYEGTIVRREQETRLLVSVRFMEQGVSVKLEDCQLELIDK